MNADELNEAVEYLQYAIQRGWLWCHNCSGRKCMACVFRDHHDECEDDCPECCQPIGHRSHGALLESVLRAGWDAPDRNPSVSQ